MNDGSALRPGAIFRSLSVRTKLLLVFLAFLLCAVAPSAGTWFFLRQHAPAPSPPSSERVAVPVSNERPSVTQTYSPIQRRGQLETSPPASAQSAAATYQQQLNALTRFWGASIFVLLGIGGLLLYAVWTHVAAPLTRLKRDAVALAGGTPGHRLTVPKRRDEIGLLARAVRRMRAEIRELELSASSPPTIERLDEHRRVVSSGSCTIEYEGPQASSEDADKPGRWTVSTNVTPPSQNRPEASSPQQAEHGSELDGPDNEMPSPETGLRYDEFMAVVHPQDREHLRTRQEQATQSGIPVNLEYRLVTPAGDERILQERGTAQLDKEEAQFSGQVLDVTEQKAHEQAVARLREEYNDLLSALPDALILVEASSSKIVEVNEAAASLLDTSTEDLLGCPASSIAPSDTVDKFAPLFEKVRQHGGSEPEMFRHFADGAPISVVTDADETVPVALTITDIERANEEYLAVFFRDITQQHQTSNRLRIFEQAVDQSGDMIFITDADGAIQYANPAAEEITGYDQSELIGETPQLLRSGETPDELYEQLWEALEQGESFRGTFTDERKDGSVVELEQTITPVQDATGEVSHYVSTGRDVTERIEREARLRGLTNSIPGVVYQFYARPDGTQGMHFVSKHAESMLGISSDPETFLNAFLARVPPPHREDLLDSLDNAIINRQEWSYEIPYNHPSGEQIWLLGTSTPTQHVDELVFNGVLLDITERKQAEQASREQRDRFITLFESLPTPVLHCKQASEGTLITDVNEAFEEVFDVDADEAEGADVNNLLVPDEDNAERIDPDLLDDDRQQFEVQRKTADGVRDFRLQAASRQTDADSTELYAIYTDITRRKEREQRLRDRRQKLESLYGATSRLLAAEEPEDVFDQVHGVLQEVLDYTVLATGVVENDRIVFTNATAGDEASCPSPPPVPMTSDRVSARALHTGEIVVNDGEKASRWASSLSLARVAGLPIGEHGVVIIGRTESPEFTPFNLRLVAVLGTYAAVVLDRIERERELRDAKVNAEDAAELKTAMLANMSHEIRTPLTSINGFSEILTEELEPPHDDLAERVYESGQRLMNTFESVLQLSKLEAGTRDLDRTKDALDRIIGATVEEWKPRAADKSISLETHLPDAPIRGVWDAEFVNHIAANLLENAIKFTPKGGEVHVHVEEENGRATFEVQDTGIGIAEQFRPQMFKAFKQESEGLSREYEGAGLGLAVTKQAVEYMGGRIEVETEKDEGSCFSVHLPKNTEPLQ